MPSFDIVSEIELVELRNAVENATRELSTRFDFKGSQASIGQDECVITLKAESDFQVRQLEDLFRNHCAKRNVSTVGLELEDKPVHTGRTFSLTLTFKQGIDQPMAKTMVKMVKDKKLKVQASIQGDKIRVTGKNRDDLQECIAMFKQSDIECPLQFNNFRD